MTLGKYQIVRELGRGAMGIVYEGFDPLLERRVALKVIRKDLLESSAHDKNDNVLQRFRREAQAAARLQHPNIVMVYDYAEEGDAVFIAMELVQGKELKDYFTQKQRFPLKAILGIMLQLLDGLAYSHRNNVVHRDIKPANIILIEGEGGGKVKIADFGIARIDTSELTQIGDVMGTPSYMAPEQLLGQRVDGRADLYAAGVVLYELLTGVKPFTGSNITAIMHGVLTAAPPAPCQRNAQLPPQCDAIIRKALAKDAADRYQTADEFKAALKTIAEQQQTATVAAPPPLAVTAPPIVSYSKGILGDLKKEADQARLVKENEAARLAKLEEVYNNELSPRLLSIHRYLYDLVEQLNTLSWSVEAEYEFPGIGKVGGLKQENYRVHIDNIDTPKRVVLTFACRSPEERRYPVKTDKAEETHKFFVAQQIKYMDWQSRGPNGQVQDIVYQARLQILVTIMCQADIEKSKLVVTVVNLEGISVNRNEFDYVEIDEDWLDKLGNYVLRKLDNFGKVYITEEERQALRERLAQEKQRIEQEVSSTLTEAHDVEKVSLLKGLRQKLTAPL